MTNPRVGVSSMLNNRAPKARTLLLDLSTWQLRLPISHLVSRLNPPNGATRF